MVNTQATTETRHPDAEGLELRSNLDILRIFFEGQAAAVRSVASALPEIADAAELAARCVAGGGRLVYAAAGSSGLMALADALELPGTYGIPREQVVMLLAGGMSTLTHLRGGPEDDGDAGRAEVEAIHPGSADCFVVVAASGRTHYALEAARAAKAAGANVVGIANNAEVPLFDMADVAICLPTPPEVITGSTRMGAGTAQKVALNMMSTLMAMRLGHIYDGHMVNVVTDNDKLWQRAIGMISAIVGVDEAQANAALEVAAGEVKTAILLAAGARDAGAATALLDQHRGFLRPALEALRA